MTLPWFANLIPETTVICVLFLTLPKSVLTCEEVNKIFRMCCLMFYTCIDRGCEPQELLNKNLGRESKWVRTVLSMLFLRYSGISLVNSEVIRFFPGSYPVLEQLNFGGQLNRKAKEKLNALLDTGRVEQAVRDNLYILKKSFFENNLGKKSNEQPKKDLLFKSGMTIQEIMEYFESKDINSVDTLESWIEWYAIERLYASSGKDNLQTDFSATIVKFVDQVIKGITSYFTSECVIKLTSSDFEAIFKSLSQTADINDKLYQKKVVLEQQLTQSERKLSELNEKKEQGEALPKIAVPIAEFLDYLIELYKSLFFSDKWDSMEFYKPKITQAYFELTKYLVPYTGEAIKRPTYVSHDTRSLVFNNKGGENSSLPIINSTVPGESVEDVDAWIVLDLKMVEYLLPYYVAAKVDMQWGGMEMPQHRPHSVAGHHPYEEHVDAELERFYVKLLQNEGKDSLCEIMKQVRNELSQMYIVRLEEYGR